MSGTRARIGFPSWKAAMAASVPCPSASGASVKTIMPAARPPEVVKTGKSHGRTDDQNGITTVAPSPAGLGGR